MKKWPIYKKGQRIQATDLWLQNWNAKIFHGAIATSRDNDGRPTVSVLRDGLKSSDIYSKDFIMLEEKLREER